MVHNKRAYLAPLGKLLNAYDRGGESDVTANRLRIETYLEVVTEFPVAAVVSAVSDVLAGRASGVDARFCPSPPQLAQLCRAKVPRRNNVLFLPTRRQPEPEASEAEHKRVSEGFDRLRAELKGEPPKTVAQIKAENLRLLERRMAKLGRPASDMDTVPDAPLIGFEKVSL